LSRSTEKEKLKFRLAELLVLSILVAFMLSHSVTLARAAEPSLEEILGNLGFTNITESTVETFPAGLYEITLYAEFAGYHDTNELSYYPVATSDFTILFSGPEGNSGYVTPPIAKTFLCNSTFGLSMYVAYEGHRYFTENLMNPDGQNHSKIFLNLDEPDMYLCGFENLYGLGDRDFNDMVFSLRQKQDPMACFTVSNDSPNVLETVVFNATCSYDSDGWIANYTWDFGDSNVTTVVNPIIVHHYGSFGNYTVVLTVVDNDGLTNSTSKLMWVREHPVARFAYLPSYPLVDEVVVFNATESTPDGGVIVSYAWNFGDSNVTTVADPVITHRYDSYGNYPVVLNVTDSEGKWDVVPKSLTVRAHPHADFTWLPHYPEACHDNVTFDASASTPNGGIIVSYEWDFGDGTPHEFGGIVIHKFAEARIYSVSLTVIDSEGLSDSVQKLVEVTGTCVGGSSISIESPLLSGWINLNVVLIAAVFITASWIKRRRKTR